MSDSERKPEDRPQVDQQQQRQAATDDDQPLYGDASSDTDSDGGLDESNTKSR